MLTLTRKTEYALAALSRMARDQDDRVRARELAERLGGSPSLLMNVLKSLTQCGIVEAMRGPKGGYRLSRSAKEVSLFEVIEAIEGPMRLAGCCVASDVRSCGLERGCSIKAPLRDVHHGLCAFLDQITVAQIAFDRVSVGVRKGTLPRGTRAGRPHGGQARDDRKANRQSR